MKRLWRFLGSIWFAVPLLLVAASVVIAGTFIESSSGSHEVAAGWIYAHPLFNLLLALFFVNILVSALHRYPWKRRHVPFLLTHLGLLMVIGGTMTKNIFGLQGHMILHEGSGSNRLLLTGTENILFRWPRSENPLKWQKESQPINRASYVKSASCELEGFCKRGGVVLFGQPPIPRGERVPLRSEFEGWMGQVDLNEAPRTLTFVNDERLIAVGEVERYETDLKLDAYNAFDRGLRGYSVEVAIPKRVLLSAEERREALESWLSDKFKSEPLLSGLDSQQIVAMLEDWQEGWLYAGEIDVTLPKNMEPLFNAMRWSALLMPEASKLENPLPFLQEKGWPLPANWEEIDEPLPFLQGDIYRLAPELPQIEIEVPKATMLSSLFRLLNITIDELLELWRAEQTETISIEAPLSQRIKPGEEGPPAVVARLEDKSAIALSYDPTGEGIAWPVLSGSKLISFQPKEVELPYHIHLHEAFQEFYPGSSAPKSYHAAIRVNGLPFHLEMNQVFEADDGTRFYLSSISSEPGKRKTVQLIVNYDPVRYSVTYPGALLLAIGMVWILFKSKKKSPS